ncbi:MAG: LysR family transcriptional regulator [Chloroflexi bacterium]|nr:LysR family transcriptional regulator [Chloroflexota bacterium]
MELHQLEGFLTVARTGSFTRAAEELFLTQPALSLKIKALEKSLGERLFERQGRKLLLTPAGRILLARAEQILGLVEQTNEEVQALKGLTGGRLVIGTNDSNCLYVLPDLIRTFRERFPNVELYLTNSHSTQVASWVIEGHVDFGLVTLPIVDPHIESRPLFWRQDVLICSPDHPLCAQSSISLEDLVTLPLLLLDRGSNSRVQLDRLFEKAGVTPSIVMELGSIEVIKQYVQIGLGVSVIPGFAAEKEIEKERLHAKLLGWLPGQQVGVIQRRKGYLSPAAEMFLELLEDHVADRWGTAAMPSD